MKFILFASIISFAVAAAIGSADDGDANKDIDINNNAVSTNIYKNNINYRPFKDTLRQSDCNDIVNAFISVLQNKEYRNKSPRENYKKYLEEKFVERSGSINSLISPSNDVNANVVNGRDAWFKGVQQNPVRNIKASKIYVVDRNKCLWQWRFGSVGSGKYDIHGFNLFYISDNKKIAGADIEFNSLGWGANTEQVEKYCKK